jgi:hypothetical protein
MGASKFVGSGRAAGKGLKAAVLVAVVVGVLPLTARPTFAVTTKFCNTQQITDDSFSSGLVPLTPYPSSVGVSGLSGTVTKVTVDLKDFTTKPDPSNEHYPEDIDVLLASPAGTPNLIIMSDVGGDNTVSHPVSHADFTIDDAAPGFMQMDSQLVAGTYKPTNDNNDFDTLGDTDVFSSPAPAPSSATTLSTFNGINPNGAWQLYVMDDTRLADSDFLGGWCINVTTATTAPNPHTNADFDGDHRTDVSVFRPSGGSWFVHQSSGGDTSQVYGAFGDIPVPADYDGDGKNDLAIFRPATGLWSIHNSTAAPADTALTYGINADVPVPADYDGDGKADVAVFRRSTGAWFIHQSTNGADVAVTFGVSEDIPVVGDYDGDGKTDIAVFRPSSGTWFVHKSSGGDTALAYGASTDAPVPGDYDGDGKTDIAIFRSSTGLWSIHNSGGSPADTALTYGITGDVPVPGDYDGDGKADVGVFRPDYGGWYYRNSSTGTDVALTFGVSGDGALPLPAAIRRRLP